MFISKKLRLAYIAEWLSIVSVSAVPVEHSPVVEEADGNMVVILGKREENSESLKRAIGEAVGLHHDIMARHDRNEDSDGDSKTEGGDLVHSADSSDKSLPGGRDNATLNSSQSSYTVAKKLVIAGGATAALILIVTIAFWLYKTKGRIFRRANSGHWKHYGAHRLRDTVYDEKSSVYPKSAIFGGGSSARPGMEREYSIPGMPFPPPAALAPPDTSVGRRQSRKHLLIRTSLLLPEGRPVCSPSPANEKGTFYDGASDVDSSSSLEQEELPIPPPVYTTDRLLLSPSQSSSISNVESRKPPTTPTNNRQPSYAQIYPPPPIPESNTTPRNAPIMVSRFSWTTTTTSEAPSGAKSVRSSLDSEPRFRGVNSWVSHQAGRLERGERVAQLQLEQQHGARNSSSPETPREFSHNPGAPVGFLAHRARVESAELDGRLSRGGGR
ncbi:unnamed protein product [Tuber melanosporum]|uniref:(Perigord truffle) hypothetical protein n=1 Tax=Tuber melanosporum (strain Mel28) TaxID=656061 RepID=D5GH34_TUBMM|nr:uncharacterized protein GSTUM_00007685001 [Tuber melanosporum]CAZ83827.1 unnamed protein product [Tuber melanosporum]